MSKVLSVNAGSSSLKFQLFDMPTETVLCQGHAERIGLANSFFTLRLNGNKNHQEMIINNHFEAVKIVIKALYDSNIISSLDEIKGIGHRIVQGGYYFSSPTIVDDDVLEKVDELAILAPLHNHAHIVCYKAFKEILPNATNVFVFDTAFHQTIKEDNYTFPLPYKWRDEYKLRKYGAHGISHEYLALRYGEISHKDIKKLNIITAHLGNGASISAIKNGECIATSMGLTPLGGLMMGTRCGDLDPSAILYMMDKLSLKPNEMSYILNKESGFYGISEISSDARDVDKAILKGNRQAKLSRDMFINHIIEMIGSYYMKLGHVDALIIAGGIGENNKDCRKDILKGLEEGMGLLINYDINDKTHGNEAKLSLDSSKTDIYVIPTKEELAIARATYKLLR